MKSPRLFPGSPPPSRHRLLITSLLVIAFVIGASAALNKVYAAPVQHSPVQHSPVQHSQHSHPRTDQRPTPDPGGGCGCRPHRMVRKFRRGALGNSAGRTVPSTIQHRLHRYFVRHHMIGVALEWYRHRLQDLNCVMNHLWLPMPGGVQTSTAFCLTAGHNPTVHKIEANIARVRIVCGGAAAIALIGTHNPAIAFGTGVAACAYSGFASQYLKWLG